VKKGNWKQAGSLSGLKTMLSDASKRAQKVQLPALGKRSLLSYAGQRLRFRSATCPSSLVEIRPT
jgi:hypothetical protein